MRTLSFGAGHVGAVLLALSSQVSDAQLASCAAIEADRDRLACYDALARAERSPAKEPAPSPPATQQPREGVRVESATALEQRWELRPDLQQGTFKLLPYRPLYALLHGTSDTNTDPRSPTRALGAQDIELDRLEGKLQLSFKTKLAQHVLGSSTDLWFGYTQQSYWQFANSRYSSPFRETNYEPEAILIHPLNLQAQGINARYAGFSFTINRTAAGNRCREAGTASLATSRSNPARGPTISGHGFAYSTRPESATTIPTSKTTSAAGSSSRSIGPVVTS